jgi:hypothetical protein
VSPESKSSNVKYKFRVALNTEKKRREKKLKMPKNERVVFICVLRVDLPRQSAGKAALDRKHSKKKGYFKK